MSLGTPHQRRGGEVDGLREGQILAMTPGGIERGLAQCAAGIIQQAIDLRLFAGGRPQQP